MTEHYLQTLDADFEKAAAGMQKAVQSGVANNSLEITRSPEALGNQVSGQLASSLDYFCQSVQMAKVGLEPTDAAPNSANKLQPDSFLPGAESGAVAATRPLTPSGGPVSAVLATIALLLNQLTPADRDALVRLLVAGIPTNGDAT